MLNRLSRFAGIAVVSCLVSLAGTASVAMAQPGGGGGRGMMGGMMGGGGSEAPVSAADVDRMVKVLSLTPDQKEAAKFLFDGAMAAWQPKADAFNKLQNDARAEFRETRDPSVWQPLMEKGQELRKQRGEAEQSFMTDVKALLTDQQASLWPKYERDRTRSSTMRQGLMSGERADVIRIVEGLKLTPEVTEKITPTLEAYETELDGVLTKRNELFERGMSQANKMREAFMSGDMTEATKMFDEGREAAGKVRDVNRRFAKQVEGQLPPEDATKFSAEFRKESFPQIYRTTRYAGQVIDAASGFEIDESVKTSIKSIKETYDRQTQTINEKAEVATDASEANMTLMTMFGGGSNEAMNDIRKQRRELEDKSIEQVKALLTEDQVKQLPERGADSAAGGGFGGGGGGAGGGGGNRPADATEGTNRQRPRNRNTTPGGGQTPANPPK